jgi:drug/metabolite transporter (DMT)-like permease
MWLFFALLFPFLFAVICVLDAYCVEKVFDRAWMGAVTSSLASAMAFLLAPLVLANWQPPTWKVIAIALLAGTMTQLGQAIYFQALEYSEAGIVAAYINLVPVMLPVFSYLAFGQAFGFWTYLGIALNIVAAVSMCLIDSNLEARWKSFFMMLLMCVLYSAAVLLEKEVFNHVPVLEGFLLITTGIVLSGALPLLASNIRRIFRANMTVLKPAIATLLLIEVINLAAIYARHQALSRGDPSLTEAVATVQPAWTFLLSFAFLFIAPKLGDPLAKQRLWLKLLLVVLMVVGVKLISGE